MAFSSMHLFIRIVLEENLHRRKSDKRFTKLSSKTLERLKVIEGKLKDCVDGVRLQFQERHRQLAAQQLIRQQEIDEQERKEREKRNRDEKVRAKVSPKPTVTPTLPPKQVTPIAPLPSTPSVDISPPAYPNLDALPNVSPPLAVATPLQPPNVNVVQPTLPTPAINGTALAYPSVNGDTKLPPVQHPPKSGKRLGV